MGKGFGSGALVVALDNDGLFAGIAALKDDDDLAGFEELSNAS